MRKIGLHEIEDIALGAALLGAGGGGDPYIGKLVAMSAIRECGPVTLLSPEEVPDDALDCPHRHDGSAYHIKRKRNRRKRISGFV